MNMFNGLNDDQLSPLIKFAFDDYMDYLIDSRLSPDDYGFADYLDDEEWDDQEHLDYLDDVESFFEPLIKAGIVYTWDNYREDYEKTIPQTDPTEYFGYELDM